METGTKKSRWLWILPVGCLGLIVVCAGLVAATYGIVRTSFRSSEPYQVGVSRAKANDEVVAALGTPIEEGAFPMGSIEVNGGSGTADLTIPIHGPDGEGTVYVQAEKFGGSWEYRRIVVEVEGRQIDLLAETDEEGTIDL
jgi:hypothetical protein